MKLATPCNEITGDTLITRPPSEAYSEGWDRIFGKKKKAEEQPQQEVQAEPSSQESQDQKDA